MSMKTPFLPVAGLACALMMAACADRTADLKQKTAELERRVSTQEQALEEFVGKFSQPKDFSADIQRIEDQQDRTAQMIKTKVDPINMKLEEFREWAQEAQKERTEVAAKLKAIDSKLARLGKRAPTTASELDRVKKQTDANTKRSRLNGAAVKQLSDELDKARKELTKNDARIVKAVKNALEKADLPGVSLAKEQSAELEKRLTALRKDIEDERRQLEALRKRAGAAAQPDLSAIVSKLSDLESLLASQKEYLLETAAKVHALEQALGR